MSVATLNAWSAARLTIPRILNALLDARLRANLALGAQDARWAVRPIETGCGVAINPGHAVGFEIAAEGLPGVLQDFGVVKEGP
jgi:glycine cleavage system aminomethyltransferase T